METNKVKQLHEFGQSIWLDFLDRNLIVSGRLKEYIEKDGLRGGWKTGWLRASQLTRSHR